VIVAAYGHGRRDDGVLEVAVDLAARLDAAVHVVHAIDLDDYPIDPGDPDQDEKLRRRLDARRRRVGEVFADAPRGYTFTASPGGPVDLAIAAAAASGALMIVTGTRGEGPSAELGRLACPSVSHRLIAQAGRPVLVVPPEIGRPPR
jgi:nucleotide-binding universal stress UspA family protein